MKNLITVEIRILTHEVAKETGPFATFVMVPKPKVVKGLMTGTFYHDFWATVCKTVRFMLSDRCPVYLSVCLSCLRRWCTVAKRLDGSR